MRFPTAWANITDQNITLKTVIVTLSVSLVALSVLAAKAGLRDPVVVERGCFTRIPIESNPAPTEDEMKSFVREAVPARFNTIGDYNLDFLSIGQKKSKSTEQAGLAKKNMRQVVIVNKVAIEDEVIKVDADRLVSVDKIRSAFSFPLTVTISKTSRSQSNPYGLVLTNVTPIEKKDDQ